jgi:hypothetical protein
MKQLLLMVAVLASFGVNAQKYKDSLYSEYKRVYWEAHQHEMEYTKSLFYVSEQVFSLKNPAMRYAIKQSKLSDSAAISLLGSQTIERFLDDKFLSWAAHHYEKDMAPILKVYSDEICGRLTTKMRSNGKMAPSDIPKKLEAAYREASIEATNNPAFVQKTGKLREEHGVDEILHSVDNLNQYMYVHCAYMRKYLVKASIDNAMAKRKASRKK